MPHIMISGLQDIAERYDGFILDIWGVLHDGIKPFAGTVDCLTKLMDAGKRVCLLSNTPDSADMIVRRLAAIGIGRDLYHDLVTAGDCAGEDIRSRTGQRAWYLGARHPDHIGLDEQAMTQIALVDTPDKADFLINDLFDVSDADFAALKPQLRIAADRHLPMICGNPDLVVNIGKALKTCPGTYAAYYETIGGVVAYHGKPHRPVYERAHQKLGAMDKARIVAVGDSLHTDIQGANNFGIDCVFNIAGIHWEEIALSHAPDEADTKKIMAIVDGQDHKPDYILGGFKW